MPIVWPMAIALLAWADPPPPAPAAASGLSPRDVVAALESVMGDAIARAEGSVVAIAREKSDDDETLAVRGREPALNGVGAGDRRFGPAGGLVIADAFNADVVSFDYGSGVVVGETQILTAYHVVRGAKALHVRAAGRQAFDAEIIAADPRSDLAVIAPRETPGVPAPKLTPLALGDAAGLRKGAFLVALGNPFNAARDGRASASWGILSNVARRLDPSSDDLNRQGLQLRNYPTLFQLDAKLNLGMSGGAVVNMKGELVALTTAAANAAGFDAQAGYAIPMDALGRNVVEALKQGKEYEYGLLGIILDRQNGTSKVMSANPGTPAALGGVQVGDEILDVGGLPVVDSDSLVVAINSIPAGEPVKLKIRRNDQPAEIERTVQLAKLKLHGRVIATSRPAPWRGLRVDYTSTIAGTALDNNVFDAMAREGVVVTEVETGSEAEKAGLKTGQLISRVNALPVRNPRDFAKTSSGLKGPVTLKTDQGDVTVK